MMSDEQVSFRPEPIPLTEYLRRWGVVLGPFLGVTTAALAMHYVWHGFDPVVIVLLWLPAGATQVFFSYRRRFRPDRLPSMLHEDSDELARLRRKNALLKWLGYAGTAFCVLLGITARQLSGVHPGEARHLPDVFWLWIALPVTASSVCVFWSNVIEAQIKQRTLPRVKPVGRGRRSPMVISGRAFQGNRFHSDHWGEPGSNTQVHFESDS